MNSLNELNSYTEVVKKLESLQIMPKTMPGLEKIKKAMQLTDWASEINSQKIIVVAGTNGKGSTCATLEKLLLAAGQRVGLYTSPHLVSTTERIRLNGVDISQEIFVQVYRDVENIISSCELSHFEALTLMMGHYFFSDKWAANLDFIILEVGLGGLYDATNAFSHKYNVITKLGLDHVNILGNSLTEVAVNKFGIVGKKSIVVHQKLDESLVDLKHKIQRETNSNWVEVPPAKYELKTKKNRAQYFLEYEGEKIETNLVGKRGAENIMTALTTFEVLGFNPLEYADCLKDINWSGRFQKVELSGFKCPVYLSGDHNEQGVGSLVEILNEMQFLKLHLILGIGADKNSEGMMHELSKLQKPFDLYLTETPFKGRKISEYPVSIQQAAVYADSNYEKVAAAAASKATDGDLCVVSGSLYLVGEFLKNNVSK